MRSRAGVLVLCVLLGSIRATAQDAPETVLVGVELTSDGIHDVRPLPPRPSDDVVPADPPGRTVAVVTITQAPCDGASASFVVRIDDRITRKQVERTVELDDAAAPTRPRALALAVAELMRASWAELALREPETSAPASIVEATLARARVRVLPDPRDLGAPIADPPRIEPAEREPRSRAAMTVAFLVRSFPSAGAAPIGARAGVDLRLFPELVMGVHAEVGVASAYHALGIVELGLASASVGAGYTASMGDAELMIGARASAGVAWASGQPHDSFVRAGSGAGPIVSVAASLELDVPVYESLALRFGFDVGGVPLGFEARAAGVPITAIAGAMIGAWAGLALSP